MDNLPALVQALPPELYNEIFELTFTPPSEVYKMSKDYLRPSCLQVNRASRARFAASYYGKAAIFTFDKNDNYRMLVKSLESIPQEHLEAITDIRIQTSSIHQAPISPTERLFVAFRERLSCRERLPFDVRGSISVANVLKTDFLLPDGSVEWISMAQAVQAVQDLRTM